VLSNVAIAGHIETIDANTLNEAIDVTVLKKKLCSNRAAASNEKLRSNIIDSNTFLSSSSISFSVTYMSLLF